jgi:hypothetical protein
MTLDDTVASWQQAEVVRLLKNAPGTQYQESDDANKAIIRDWVRSLLQKGPVTVVFVKADGTEREMKCTLSHDLLPAVPTPNKAAEPEVVQESKPRKAPDVHSLRVFDLDKNEWRSFRFERLRKVSAEIVFG